MQTNTRNEAIGVLVQEAMKAEDALKTMLATMAVSGDKESRLIEYEDILNIYQDSQKQTVVSSNSSVPGESVSAMLQGLAVNTGGFADVPTSIPSLRSCR